MTRCSVRIHMCLLNELDVGMKQIENSNRSNVEIAEKAVTEKCGSEQLGLLFYVSM